MALKISMYFSALITVTNLLVLHLSFRQAHGFVRNFRFPTTPFAHRGAVPTMLWYAETVADTDAEIDVEGIREELESYYTIPTENFDEMTEAEAYPPSYTEEETIYDTNDSSNASESSNKTIWENIQQNLATKGEEMATVARETLQKFSSAVSSSDLFDEHLSDDEGSEVSSNSSSSSRQERYEIALTEGMSMSSSTLKQELKDRGMYTTGIFFEKSDLVKAYANAIADAVERKDSKTTTQEFDPSYRSVIMQKFDRRTLSRGDLVIDIPTI